MAKGLSDDADAVPVLSDALAITVPDECFGEERFITIGLDNSGILRVVVHAFERIDTDITTIRIISARQATTTEELAYLGEE